MIHSSCEALGFSSALIDGTARFNTVRSTEYSMHGSAMTARPIHWRRVARGGASLFISVALPRYVRPRDA